MGCCICKHILLDEELETSSKKDLSNNMTGDTRKKKLMNSRIK